MQSLPTFDLVLFGGTGDLAMRKLLPALYRRSCAGQIAPGQFQAGKKYLTDNVSVNHFVILLLQLESLLPMLLRASQEAAFYVLNRDYVMVLVTDPRGQVMAGLAVVLMVFGGLMIRRIVQITL